MARTRKRAVILIFGIVLLAIGIALWILGDKRVITGDWLSIISLVVSALGLLISSIAWLFPFSPDSPANPQIEPKKQIDNLTKKPFDKPTPTEIMDYLRKLPPFQREDATDNYKGIKVSWIARIESSEKKSNGNVGLMTQYERSFSPAIYFEVELVKYPELKIINKDQEFKVEGEIDKVSPGGSITLTDCKLYF